MLSLTQRCPGQRRVKEKWKYLGRVGKELNDAKV